VTVEEVPDRQVGIIGKSNQEYGTSEAPLIQENGDPLCDLLYTTNFAFFGLHEAAAATGDPTYREAEDRLADFLCRIQVTSEARDELDGAWFRAFDFRRWDYWASNADLGWGAWSIESGWTQGWITSVLAMRRMGTSFWDMTGETNIGEHLDELVSRMFPESDPAFEESVRTERHPDPARPDVAEGVTFERQVVFGCDAGRDLTGDVFTPTRIPSAPRPAVVFLHGGSWMHGGPSQFHFHANRLADRFGMFTISVDYRLSGEARFPKALQDAKCAIRWVRSRADELNIDPDRVAVSRAIGGRPSVLDDRNGGRCRGL
jgi:hypothetical protein